MTWPYMPPYGYPPQQPVVFIPTMPGQTPPTIPPDGVKLSRKEMRKTINFYKSIIEELEKKKGDKKDEKKEDKKGVDPAAIVKMYTLLVLLLPIIGPLYLMWLKSLLH